MTPWFSFRNKDLRALTRGQLAPCALLLWSLMGVDRLVLLTPHLVVPHQLSSCPTLWEVTGDGLQWSTLYLEPLESCSPEKV